MKSGKNKIDKRLIKAVLIIFSSVFIILIWNSKDNLSPDRAVNSIQDMINGLGNGKGFPYDIVGSHINKGNFQVLNKDLVFVSDTSFVSINSSSKEIANRQHSFNSPILKLSGTKAIIYDLLGKKFRLECKSKTILDELYSENIIAAGIADNGTYGLITESKDYFSELTIFSSDGKKQYYKYYFSDCYAYDIAFSSDGNLAAVVGCSVKNGASRSIIYIFEYNSNEPKMKMEYVDNKILEIKFLYDGDVIAVGDKLTSLLDMKRNKKQDYDYSTKVLTSFDINKKDGVLLSLSKDTDACELVTLNNKNEVTNEITTNSKISDVSFKSGKIAALSCDKILCYNNSGNKVGEWNAESDAKKIKLFSSNGAYVLGVTKIRQVIFE